MLKRHLIILVALFFCTQAKTQINVGGGFGSSGPVSVNQPTNSPSNSSGNYNPGNFNEGSINDVVSVVHKVEETQNFINLGNLSPDSNVALPFGIIKDIGAARYVIAVDSLKFKPDGAFFSAYAAIDFPGTTKKMAFRASNIKFNPAGVVGGNQARLYLASTHTIQINPTVKLRLLDNGENWIEWDCNGFKAINLVGNFEFAKGKILPDSTANNNDPVVKASFNIYTQDIHNFIVSVNMKPFCVSGLKGWGFTVNQAAVDMSELANSPGFGFPQGYPVQNLVNAESWTGFSLKNLTVRLPKEVSKTGQKQSITVDNMLIDNMGLTGTFQANNLFTTSEGSMSGWAFSIDELGVGFVTNRINSGHIKGKVRIPVMADNENLLYTADINHNHNTGQTNYNFVVSPASNLTFGVFSAKVNLNNSSNITVFVQNGNFKPSANLTGNISFNAPKLNSGGGMLGFENLIIVPESPYITNGVFTLGNINGGQTKAHNFPIQINSITFGINQGAPVLGFSVTLNLSDHSTNALSVGTGVLVKGKINTTQQTYNGDYPVTHTKTNWQFDRVSVTGVSIDLQTSPFTLKGSILFKEDDPVYGNGFMGTLEMKIPKIMENPGQVSVCFGKLPEYRYFYVDAKIPVKFTIAGYVDITRLVGGLYYHMTPNKTSEGDMISLAKNPVTPSGNVMTYVPSQATSLGLKAGVSYQATASERAFNGDLMLEINFTPAGGLGIVKLSGEVYSMATVAQRQKAPVKGAMVMQYDAPQKIFDAAASVTVNAYNAITGTGTFKIHYDPQIWYLCVGRPSQPCNINFFNLANAPSYFMVGNSIESPVIPSEIAGLSSLTGVLNGGRNGDQLKNGAGFCAGSKIQSSLNKTFGWDFFNVQAGYSFIMGWDMMMTNYGENAHCSGSDTKVGMNGWLAQGAMYLHMGGKISINGSYKWPSDCPKQHEKHPCGPGHCCCVRWTTPCIINGGFSKTIFEADINAVVAAKGPKPIYFTGQVTAHYEICEAVGGNLNFDFQYGENCTPVN